MEGGGFLHHQGGGEVAIGTQTRERDTSFLQKTPPVNNTLDGDNTSTYLYI